MLEGKSARQVQIFLLKQSIGELESALHPDNRGRIRQLPGDLPFRGALVTKPSFSKKPEWAEFIEEGLGEELTELHSASASALLLVESEGRFFAVTWGYGKSLLDPASIERNFGLKVVLNAVDPAQIRSLDLRRVEEMTFHTRRQSSRVSEVSGFGVDTSRDLLRGLTGIPADPAVGSRISGAESVTLSMPMVFAELGDACAQMLRLASSDKYKERFSWIDHLQLVRDPEMMDSLDDRLSKDLAAQVTENMHLAPPEVLDWNNVSGFFFWDPGSEGQRYSELDIEDAVNEIMTRARTPISADALHRRYVWVEFRENAPVAKYNLYSCLVYETELDGVLYVLSDGDWHQVDRSWAESVREEVANIPRGRVPLPAAQPGEIEGEYNKRAAAEVGAVLMDACTVQYGGFRDKLEFCDLLTHSRQLVHVKRKTRSATLSHLFMQGLNSALLLAQEPPFRSGVVEKAADVGLDIVDLIPDVGFQAQDFEVVYAVIAPPNPKWPRSLPFFSQLSLAGVARSLRQSGFRVALQLVPIGPSK